MPDLVPSEAKHIKINLHAEIHSCSELVNLLPPKAIYRSRSSGPYQVYFVWGRNYSMFEANLLVKGVWPLCARIIIGFQTFHNFVSTLSNILKWNKGHLSLPSSNSIFPTHLSGRKAYSGFVLYPESVFQCLILKLMSMEQLCYRDVLDKYKNGSKLCATRQKGQKKKRKWKESNGTIIVNCV